MEFIRINTCRINNVSGFNFTLAGLNYPVVTFFLQVSNFCIKFELHAVGCSIFSKCNVHSKGADNSAGRCIQCCYCLVCNIGLQLYEFFSVNNAQIFDTVLHTSVIQRLQIGFFFLVNTYNQRTVILIVEIQFFGKSFHHLVTFHIQLRHKGTCFCVKSGMYNCTVCLGCSTAYVFFLFHYTDIQFVSGKFSCGSTS